MVESQRVLSIAVLLALGAACHKTPGTHPADMSATEHDAAAADADQRAVEHEAQFDPGLETLSGPDCHYYCFSSNPTDVHLDAARRLRREADAHRRASADLRVAEERACADIPDLHRDYSPFFHRDSIVGVDTKDPAAVVVHFEQVRNTTAARLQTLVDCHLARNAALGFEMEEMEFCPLATRGVSATVTAVDQGFDIQLMADTEEGQSAVVERVEALVGPEE